MRPTRIWIGLLGIIRIRVIIAALSIDIKNLFTQTILGPFMLRFTGKLQEIAIGITKMGPKIFQAIAFVDRRLVLQDYYLYLNLDVLCPSVTYITVKFSLHTTVVLIQGAYLLPPANEDLGKVMFLCLSVILFTGGLASQHASQVTWPGMVCIGGGGSLPPGGCLSLGVCIQGEGLHPGGRLGRPPQALWDMVNKRAVRILLECILVFKSYSHVQIKITSKKYFSERRRGCGHGRQSFIVCLCGHCWTEMHHHKEISKSISSEKYSLL